MDRTASWINLNMLEKILDPSIKLVLASYTLQYIKGQRGSNLRELSFVTELNPPKVSTLLTKMKSGKLGSAFEVKQDFADGLVKIHRHKIPCILPKSQLSRKYLRIINKASGPYGKLYGVYFRTPLSQTQILTRVETADIKEVLASFIPQVIEYLEKAPLQQYKFLRRIALIVVKNALIVIRRIINLYSDVGFTDNRIVVLQNLEKLLEIAESCFGRIHRNRELIKELQSWHQKLQTIEVST
jgi:hypothetical protein